MATTVHWFVHSLIQIKHFATFGSSPSGWLFAFSALHTVHRVLETFSWKMWKYPKWIGYGERAVERERARAALLRGKSGIKLKWNCQWRCIHTDTNQLHYVRNVAFVRIFYSPVSSECFFFIRSISRWKIDKLTNVKIYCAHVSIDILMHTYTCIPNQFIVCSLITWNKLIIEISLQWLSFSCRSSRMHRAMRHRRYIKKVVNATYRVSPPGYRISGM